MRFRALLLPLALVSCRAEEDPMARLVRAVSPPRLERTVRRLAAFETRHTASAADDPARGIGAARRWIEDELEQIAGLEVGTQAFPAAGNQRLDAGVEIVNVYAVLAGTSARDRYYVVSGHYDSRALDPRDARSRAPGANDDASGVAVVLELARIFAAHPTEASLIFLCVAGEEQGLLGSRHFARDAREKGLHIAGMLTNDIVGNTLGPRGRRHRRYVRVFSEGTPVAETTHAMASRLRRSLGAEWDSPSRQLARYVREQAAAHLRSFQVKLVFRPDRFLRGGDHLGFNEAGYAAVRLTEPFEDFARQHVDVTEVTGDLPEHVDYAYLARVAAVNVVALASLANAPAPPRGVRIHTEKIEHATTLSWQPSPEDDLSHYEVVWRDTTAADWQRRREVRGKTEVTLPLSKDDRHFGVRAVDRDGFRSPVSYPTPWRR
ncbi:MAG: M28 family metallopeptidase [Planctomycetota bacterium]